MKIKVKNFSLKTILIFIAIGIWAIVLQNAGVIPTNQNVKVVNPVKTYVVGGTIDYLDDGNVDAEITGDVSVDNTVDVNLDEVLGYPVGCRKSYTIDGRQYNSIDVSPRN